MKKFIATFLALVLTLSIGVMPSFAMATPSDIGGHTYEMDILKIDSYNGLDALVVGGKFYPDQLILQREFVTMVNSIFPGRALGIYGGEAVAQMDWAGTTLVTAAKALGYTTSWVDLTVEQLTRARACMLLVLWIESDPGLRATAGTASQAPTPTAPTTTPSYDYGGLFSDVPMGAYYYEPVCWMYNNKYTTGTSATTFSPESACSKAQILTFVWRAAGSPQSKYVCPISGIDKTSYFYPALCWAGEKGMISGSDDGTDPTKVGCTRAMMVFYLWRAAGAPEADYSDYLWGFTDIPETASYRTAIGWALQRGITSGSSKTTFSPYDLVTRGQIATFLYRAYASR